MKEAHAVALSLKPLADRVVIEPKDESADKSPGGIYIPDTAKEKPQRGEVVAAGPGRTTDDGKLIKTGVNVGDTVVYSKYAGTEYTENGTEYLIVRESDILAVVEK
ncbi:MAG: co-chaperone GroES [Dehalococcoidia bacterium]